jgi:hypothetical protein
MYIRELGWGGIDWIDLAQDKDQLRAIRKCDNKTSGSVKYWEIQHNHILIMYLFVKMN